MQAFVPVVNSTQSLMMIQKRLDAIQYFSRHFINFIEDEHWVRALRHITYYPRSKFVLWVQNPTVRFGIEWMKWFQETHLITQVSVLVGKVFPRVEVVIKFTWLFIPEIVLGDEGSYVVFSDACGPVKTQDQWFSRRFFIDTGFDGCRNYFLDYMLTE